MKHCEKNEIGDRDVGKMINDSLRLADKIGILNKKSIHVVEEDEQEQEPEKEVPQNAEKDVTVDAEDDENAELMADEEAKIALKLKDKTNVAGNINSLSL